jgi:hypothetical protein
MLRTRRISTSSSGSSTSRSSLRNYGGRQVRFFILLLILASSIILVMVFLWSGALLLSSPTYKAKPTASSSSLPDRNKLATSHSISTTESSSGDRINNKDYQHHDKQDGHHNSGENNSNGSIAIALQLRLEDDSRIDIRLQLLDKQAPDAARFILSLLQHPEKCSNTTCTIYRGEPVPSWWGSPERPDRYFDGGRWGPPYALIQGGFVQTATTTSTSASFAIIPNAQADGYRPALLERGMVAWAGGKGGPHFFIAMADHPEWGSYGMGPGAFNRRLAQTRYLVGHAATADGDAQKFTHLVQFVTPISFTIHRVQ